MPADSHDRERREHAAFTLRNAEPSLHPHLARLVGWWGEINRDHFAGRLVVGHIHLDRTPPRGLVAVERVTGDGRLVKLVIHREVGTGTHPGVRRAGGRGHRRFVFDLLFRCCVWQHTIEVAGYDRGDRGFWPAFAATANDVGTRMHPPLDRVAAFGREDADPPARCWPHCVRPDGYYDDVAEDLLDAARGTRYGTAPKEAVPTEGVMRYLLRLHQQEEYGRATAVLSRQVEYLADVGAGRCGRDADVEAGRANPDKSPLEADSVFFDRSWLDWSGGLVGQMLADITRFHAGYDCPILADALEDAGCAEEPILAHLRAKIVHGARCWVLKRLAALTKN